MHANEGGDGGGGQGREDGGDECLSPDKGICILLLGEKQRESEGKRGREGDRERERQLTDSNRDFWEMVIHC